MAGPVRPKRDGTRTRATGTWGADTAVGRLRGP